MIAVLDTNTIWRREPFRALGAWRPVLGVRPGDWRANRGVAPSASFQGYTEHKVTLPFGWASRTAKPSQAWLWTSVRKMAPMVEAVIITSPHYLPLVRCLNSEYPVFYYSSDDYRSYAGWSAERMREDEGEIVRHVKHAWFVSEGLANRARAEYGVPPCRVSVSMNATEPRFFPAQASAEPGPLPERLPRPVVGVVGGINERLDYDLLAACADMPEVGTLLLVGPLPAKPELALRTILEHPCVRAVGPQPHAMIPQWMHGLDVALIPYRRSAFNTFCSPMRLFDHLASGRPIVATDACPQVASFADVSDVASSSGEFLNRLKKRLSSSFDITRQQIQLARSRPHTWTDRAADVARSIAEILPSSSTTNS